MKPHAIVILLGLCWISGCTGAMSAGGAPAVSLSVTKLAFGHEIVGATTTAESITLKNTGTATLSVSAIMASANFAESNTCGSTLAAGASCTIDVTFSPNASGDFNGSVTVTDNAVGSPHMVALSGTGTVAGPRCAVSGMECGAPQLPPCCSGLMCIPASTRAFCN